LEEIEVSGGYIDIPVSNMRQTIATRLLESTQTIPSYPMTIACNMGSFLKLRKAINNLSKIRISVNDMLVKAIGLTNIDIPEGNQQWNGKTIR